MFIILLLAFVTYELSVIKTLQIITIKYNIPNFYTCSVKDKQLFIL